MVSIILLTYNRSERLRLSIQDVLDQTFKDFELIICDDCSTDETEVLCREFSAQDDRIKYYRHSSNLEMPANLNFGIQQSIYEIIAILHDGDRFHSDLIQQWYTAISTNESVGFVFNTLGFTDQHEKLVLFYREFEEGIIKKNHLLENVYFRRWRFDSPVYGQVMTRKKLLLEHGLLKTRYGFYADVDMWMQLLHSHDAYYCVDLLITGPTKEIQPRLFEDNLVSYFLYMFDMHLKHRNLAYQNRPQKLFMELVIFWIYSFANITYCLLLIVKNSTFKSFLSAPRLLKKNLLLVPWVLILSLYPLVYVLLKLFSRLKSLARRSIAAFV